MEIVHDFRKVFLCLIFTRNVGKFNTVRGVNINLGVALAHVEHHGILTAHFLHHVFGNELTDQKECGDRKNPIKNDLREDTGLLYNLTRKVCTRRMKSLGESGIVYNACFINLFFFFIGKYDIILGFDDLDEPNVALIGHRHKGAVIGFFNLRIHNHRHNDHI